MRRKIFCFRTLDAGKEVCGNSLLIGAGGSFPSQGSSLVLPPCLQSEVQPNPTNLTKLQQLFGESE